MTEPSLRDRRAAVVAAIAAHHRAAENIDIELHAYATAVADSHGFKVGDHIRVTAPFKTFDDIVAGFHMGSDRLDPEDLYVRLALSEEAAPVGWVKLQVASGDQSARSET